MGQTFWQLPQATHSFLFTTACRFGKINPRFAYTVTVLLIMLYFALFFKGNRERPAAACFYMLDNQHDILIIYAEEREMQVRLELAKNLINNTNLSLEDIAKNVKLPLTTVEELARGRTA